MKLTFLFFVLLLSCLAVGAATRPSGASDFGVVRFVAPGGSANNDGLSPKTPWTLDYALTQANPSTRLTLLNGIYPSIGITRSGTRITSWVKWGARIVPGPGVAGVWTATNVTDAIIEQLEVTGSTVDGISINGSNNVVRSCWVHDCAGYGIIGRLNSSSLIERNLVERNGTAPPGEAGMSLSGTNCIIRGNVFRYNQDWGCQIYAPAPYSSAECDFYDNLIYGNGGGLTVWSPSGQTNYVYSNTIISTNNNCLLANAGTLFVTNNMFFEGGSSAILYAGAGANVLSDYNLVNTPANPAGAHDVVASDFAFVSSASGLYWLSAGSPAIGKANPGVIPLVDFFGRGQTSVSDIGAFQFSSALAADTRILDPSSTNGADYWKLPAPAVALAPVISAQPQSQTVNVGQTATFTVAATGTAPLNYKWTFNGNLVGGNSNTYTRTNCQLADSGATIQVQVSDPAAVVQSSPVVLTVNAPGPTYYVAVNGSGSNDGLTPSTAWDLATGCYALTNNNTIYVLPGIYSQGPYVIYKAANGSLISQTKWGAKIMNSSGEGFRCDQPPASYGILIDGFCISNTVLDGISFSGVHDSIIRNCWIAWTANGTDPHDGLNLSSASNNLVENVLVEYDHYGRGDGRGHGIYSGFKNTIRNSIFRYNGGWGIHVYTSASGHYLSDAQVYNNLTYGNGGYGIVVAYDPPGDGIGTNYVFGNTVGDGVQCYYGTLQLSNNIILNGIHNGVMHPTTINGDYNLGTAPLLGSPHEVVTSLSGLALVNPGNGLYWLGAGSAARNQAAASVCVPVSFFGQAQVAVTDIGAFQYNANLASDTRILDPSPANPDYWALP